MADKRVKRAPARIFTVKIPLPMANKSGESDPATNFHGENFPSYG